MDEANARADFRRLNAQASVGLCVEACLPLRTHHAECDACVAVCPVGVLARSDGGFSLADGCLGCGRCMAACPMGALTVSGFGLDAVAEDNRGALCIDCQRVPASAAPAGTLRVPCLGGLTVSRLLALRRLAGTRPIHLLDRGGCMRCPAGQGTKHPVRATLTRARAWLQEAGVPESQWPVLRKQALPPSRRARTASPDQDRAPPLSRRDFFGRLTRQVAGAVSAAMDDTAGATAHGVGAGRRYTAPVRSLERDRQLVLLQQLAMQHDRRVPAHFFPAIEVEETCRNHRLCVALCPTGALRAYDDGGDSGVVFDASACIACGCCEKVCPEEALRLRPQGNGATPQTPLPLTRHALHVCEDCCAEFADPEDETHCPTCRKSRDLAKAGVDTLFRRGAG